MGHNLLRHWLMLASSRVGAVAKKVEKRIQIKHDNFERSHSFVPLAVNIFSGRLTQ